jgi:hypothetical protein
MCLMFQIVCTTIILSYYTPVQNWFIIIIIVKVSSKLFITKILVTIIRLLVKQGRRRQLHRHISEPEEMCEFAHLPLVI